MKLLKVLSGSVLLLAFGMSITSVALAQGNDGQNAPKEESLSVSPNLSKAEQDLKAQEEALLKQVQGNADSLAPSKEALEPAPELEAPAKVAEPEKVVSKEGAPDISAPAIVKKKSEEASPSVKSSSDAPLIRGAGCDPTALSSAQARIRKLSAELEETKNRLMISETEVERLALLVDSKNQSQARSVSTSTMKQMTGGTKLRVRDAGEIQAKADTDMPIATVMAEKAQLRTGPGKENSPLMTVAQGTRLAVETRSGDWYRVIAPNGTRAWISSDLIDFGDLTSADSAVRGRGLKTDDEDAAFDALSRGTKSKVPSGAE